MIPAETTEETQPIIKQGEGPVTYIVGKGETLWSIAEKEYGSGYNWLDIADANSLVDANVISEGQELIIPDVQPKKLTVTQESPSVDEITSNSINGATYTVVKGDCLWTIAVRAYGDGYMWTEIANANNLANPDIIHAGNVLSLPR